MDPILCQFIQEEQDQRSHWDQKLLVNLNTVNLNAKSNNLVDISCATGENPVTPPNAIDQPSAYPTSSKYRFPEQYRGPAALDDIIKILNRGCASCELYHQRDGTGKNSNTHQLRCSKYCVEAIGVKGDFVEGKFSKQETKPETIKRQRSKQTKSTFGRMAHSKMRAPRRKKTVDRRGQKAKTTSDNTTPLKRRTEGSRADSVDTRCHMNIQFFMSPGNGYWYLNEKSNLCHTFHSEEEEDANLLNKEDLNQNQLDMIFAMYNHGIPSGSIADIMTNLVNKDSTKGEFIAQTISNITQEMQDAMDEISELNGDFSIAEKTIKKLNA